MNRIWTGYYFHGQTKYLASPSDEDIQSALSGRLVWVYGASGSGKTTHKAWIAAKARAEGQFVVGLQMMDFLTDKNTLVDESEAWDIVQSCATHSAGTQAPTANASRETIVDWVVQHQPLLVIDEGSLLQRCAIPPNHPVVQLTRMTPCIVYAFSEPEEVGWPTSIDPGQRIAKVALTEDVVREHVCAVGFSDLAARVYTTVGGHPGMLQRMCSQLSRGAPFDRVVEDMRHQDSHIVLADQLFRICLVSADPRIRNHWLDALESWSGVLRGERPSTLDLRVRRTLERSGLLQPGNNNPAAIFLERFDARWCEDVLRRSRE